MIDALHAEPCGCTFRPITVPDDIWDGQGWEPVQRCPAHATSAAPCVHADPDAPAPICGAVHRSFGYVCEQPDLGHETDDDEDPMFGVPGALRHRMTPEPGVEYRWTRDNGLVNGRYFDPTREG